MTCCPNHDRLDLILTSDEYLDFPCGTPTAPRGEPRYCCRQCPAIGQPLALKGVWASNPVLMGYLTFDEQTAVLEEAYRMGSKYVDIQFSVPAPAKER